MTKRRSFAMLTVCLLLAGIATNCRTLSDRERAIEANAPYRTEPGTKPRWVDTPTGADRSEGKVSFTGVSRRFARVADARNDAMEDCRNQLISFYGTAMTVKGREHAALFGLSSDVFSPQTVGQRLNERIAQNVSQALAAEDFYTEFYLDSTNRNAVEVYVWSRIEAARVARVIDDFSRENAADYAERAAAEQDARRREQLDRAAEFFGGNLSGSLGL